jgi:hypothetical protein
LTASYVEAEAKQTLEACSQMIGRLSFPAPSSSGGEAGGTMAPPPGRPQAAGQPPAPAPDPASRQPNAFTVEE